MRRVGDIAVLIGWTAVAGVCGAAFIGSILALFVMFGGG